MESAFLKIINAKVLTPSGLLPNGQIIISDGKIVDITGQTGRFLMRRSSTQKDIMWLPAVSTRMYTAATDMISRKLPRKRSMRSQEHMLYRERRLYILHWQLPYRDLPGSDQDLRAHHEPPGTGGPYHGITSRRQLFEYGYERRTRP